MTAINKAKNTFSNVRAYWNRAPQGRYMSFREIAAYSVGGIGANFIICMGLNLIVSAQNMIVGGAIGVAPTDMYILYVIATLANIPLTGIRANMIDNTRLRAGKYRPYLLSMGIPTAIISLVYVWFPYDTIESILTKPLMGRTQGYIITCAVVLFFNFLLQFFYNFFNDAYTNLVHVLSPNTQERTDVLAIKSVAYSLAPSIMNVVYPLVAQALTNNNMYDIKVYRVTYPVFAIIGVILTIVVFANTKEKIIQAKTHTVQISFMDSLKAVAKNKYFWIISLAGWMGFLEVSYGNVINWSYNYGHTTNGATYALILTLTGNASLWGMLLAPFCIRKWGKKKVLVGVNMFNIFFIFAMMFYVRNIWWLFICVYLNWLVGAFEQITAPAIQADIRDYQQYKTGERIDGMFAAVLTIGNVVTLFTSAIVPAIQKRYGIFEGNGYEKPYDILDINNSGPDLLYSLLKVLIVMAGVGAIMNLIPYLFYDFTEKKQKSVVRVLKVRALFEDFKNGALKDEALVEAIDIVNYAKEMAVEDYRSTNKNDYKITDASKSKFKLKKESKKAYKEALIFNEEIDISKFVCRELDKFSLEHMKKELASAKEVYELGLDGVKNLNRTDIKKDLAAAKALPKSNLDEKEYREFMIDLANKKLSSLKAYTKYYGYGKMLEEPDYKILEKLIENEDECEKKINELYDELKVLKKKKQPVAEIRKKIKLTITEFRNAQNETKSEMDRHAKFNRVAKAYKDCEKLIQQEDSYDHYDEIALMYETSKENARIERERVAAEVKRLEEENKAFKEKLKAEKAAKKKNK